MFVLSTTETYIFCHWSLAYIVTACTTTTTTTTITTYSKGHPATG